MLPKPGVRNVFAPTNYGIRRGQAPQFSSERECAVQTAREASPFLSLGEESLSFRHAIGGRKTGDLALDERQLYSTDAGWLSGTKDVGQDRTLQVIDVYKTGAHLTTKECG
jgi:hypothetical protein